MRTRLEDIAIFSVIAIMIIVGVGGMVILVKEVFFPGPQFCLKKAEWTCTKSHTQLVTGSMLIGKMIVPTSHLATVCDEYERNQ